MMHLNQPVLAQEQDGLLQLEAQGLRLDKLQRATIHLNKGFTMQGDALRCKGGDTCNISSTSGIQKLQNLHKASP